MIDNITITILLILLAWWNGKIITWQQAKAAGKYVKAKRYSKQWHSIGKWWRIVLALYFVGYLNRNEYIELFTTFTWGNFFYLFGNGLWVLNLSYTIYDLIINLTMRAFNPNIKLSYIDDKNFNAFTLKYLGKKGTWIFRIILIVINILIFAL
jgi:hypothetical protein